MSWKDKVLNQKGKLFSYGLVTVVALATVKATVLAPQEVLVVPVAERDLVAEVQGTGTVSTDVLAIVGSKITGRIERVLVDEGDLVRTGQLVAVLEDTDLRREVERTRARLEAERVSAWQAKRAWEREEELVATGAVSEEEAEIYEERYRVAESAVHAAEAEFRYQEFKLSETKVLAPVSGLVTERWVDPGGAVVAGQSVVTVADTSLILVAANVDQRFSGKLRPGQSATVVLRGRPDRPLEGQVYRVNPRADPVTEEMRVEVMFPLPAEELQVGQWAEVYIAVDAVKNALVVAKPALMPFGNDRFVFVAEPGGRVRRVQVRPGATNPRLPVVAVQGELEPDERVILRPIGLQGGETVRATPAQTVGGTRTEGMPQAVPATMNARGGTGGAP